MSNIESLNLYDHGVGVLRHHETGESVVDNLLADPVFSVARRLNAGEVVSTPHSTVELDKLVLNGIADNVKGAIKYVPDVEPWDSASLGNCLSFTSGIDELSAMAGYSTRVIFCNDHYFNFVVNSFGVVHMLHGETRPMRFFDATSNRWTTHAFTQPDWQAIVGQSTPAQSFLMETRDLRIYAMQMKDDGRYVELPWLNDTYPAATIMMSDYARIAMRAYSNFISSMRLSRDVWSVTSRLEALEGNNPQAETRPRVNQAMAMFGRLVRGWARDPNVPTDDIVTCIAQYDAAMPAKTKGLSVFVGDQLRKVGDIRRDDELVDIGLRYYHDAELRSRNPHDETLRAKIDKSQALLAPDYRADESARYQDRLVFSSLVTPA